MLKGLELLVKKGDFDTFGNAWQYGPAVRFTQDESDPIHHRWQTQKNMITECCNLPKEEHFDTARCTYSPSGIDKTTDPTLPFLTFPPGFAGAGGKRNGVMGNFWEALMVHRKSWEDAWKVAERKPTPRLQAVLKDFLDGKRLENDKDRPILPASMEKLYAHPIHMVFGYIVSKKGFGFDLRKFETFEDFESVITSPFLAKIEAICIKGGMYS
jgi:hypothetical protein